MDETKLTSVTAAPDGTIINLGTVSLYGNGSPACGTVSFRGAQALNGDREAMWEIIEDLRIAERTLYELEGSILYLLQQYEWERPGRWAKVKTRLVIKQLRMLADTADRPNRLRISRSHRRSQ